MWQYNYSDDIYHYGVKDIACIASNARAVCEEKRYKSRKVAKRHV